MENQQAGDIMSTRDAAQCLGVSVRTIQLWVESGNLEAWKTPGGHRRIYRQSVDNMLAARGTRAQDLRKFDILLCTADDGLAGDLSGTLRGAGADWRVRVVHNGLDALIRIGESIPDVLMIDLNQAEQGIGKLLDALQNMSFQRTMHIVALTGAGDLARALPPAIVRFTQPVATAQLMRLLRVYCELGSAGHAAP